MMLLQVQQWSGIAWLPDGTGGEGILPGDCHCFNWRYRQSRSRKPHQFTHVLGGVISMCCGLEQAISCRASEIKLRLTRRLLRWFREEGRSFPWRETDDPYEVLIAELMLQRTQAAQVVETWRAFIDDAPTLADAADMPQPRLESHLKPLGLHKRIDLIRGALEHLKADHECHVPREYSTLMNVPGIGDYTARAVLIFCFNQTMALIDANIVRIYSRIFSIDSAKRLRTNRQFKSLADLLLPKTKPKQYNWALIDFGAKVCGRNPDCGECIVADLCLHASSGV